MLLRYLLRQRAQHCARTRDSTADAHLIHTAICAVCCTSRAALLENPHPSRHQNNGRGQTYKICRWWAALNDSGRPLWLAALSFQHHVLHISDPRSKTPLSTTWQDESTCPIACGSTKQAAQDHLCWAGLREVLSSITCAQDLSVAGPGAGVLHAAECGGSFSAPALPASEPPGGPASPSVLLR